MTAAVRVAILIFLASIMSSLLPPADARADEAQHAVLVTGASTGIGRLIAEKLAAEGHFVYAGARKPEDIARGVMTLVDGGIPYSTGTIIEINTRKKSEFALIESERRLTEAQNLAQRFRKHGAAYFQFITTPGMEPTNNLAEQAIRFVVIDRRITQGTRSAAGRQWNERIWTTVATLTQQGRPILTYLRDAFGAYLHNQPAPSLLTAGP